MAAAKVLQSRQVGHRLDLYVPAQLPQTNGAQVHGPSIFLLLVVAAIHQAGVGGAVPHAQNVAGLVGSRAECPPPAQLKFCLRIAVEVDGPDADTFS